MGGRLSPLALLCVLPPCGSSGPLEAEDCNANGVADAVDVRAEPRFEGRTGFLLGMLRPPVALLCEDFDDDGALDAAVAGEESIASVIYGSRADGLVQESLAHPSLIGTIHALAAAHIDRDRLLDLVAMHDAGELSIILQQPGRTFADAVTIPTRGTPTSVAAGDLDGDGDGDIAVTTPFAVTMLWNDEGKWADAEAMENGSGPRAIVAADLDGDGRLDLATGNGFNNVSVLLQREGRSFATRHFAAGGTAVAIAAGDLDLDGDIDIVTTNAEPHDLTVFLNRGDGSLESARRSSLEVIGGPWLSLADMDGDLRLDALLPVSHLLAPGPRSTIFRGTGDGRFEPWPGSDPDLGELAAAGDLDADGDADLVVASPSGVLSVVPNEGSGAFSVETALVELRESGTVSDITMTDVDGDGDMDAFAIVADRHVAVLRNDGHGGFSVEPADPMVVEFPRTLTSIDLEPDGDPDACVFVRRFPGKALVLLRNDGTGRLESAGERSAMEIPGNTLGDGNTVGEDLDGDGLPDLAAFHSMLGTVEIYWNDGSGSVSESEAIDVPRGLSGMIAADLDGDGDRDLGFGDVPRQRVTVLENQGSRRFSATGGIDDGGGAHRLVSADLDGDGEDDLLFATLVLHDPSFHLSILLHEHGEGFSEAARIPFRDSPHSLLAADLDGDADLDVAGLIGGAVVTVINDGSGAFRKGPTYDSLAGALDLAAADIDGDGLAEIIASGGGLVVLRNRSRPASSEDTDRNGVPDECEAPPFHRGDPTADGRSDLGDVIGILQYLFLRGPSPACADAADADDDGRLGVADPVFLILHLFAGRPPPPAPGPFPAECGHDPVLSTGPDPLGCEAYAGC